MYLEKSFLFFKNLLMEYLFPPRKKMSYSYNSEYVSDLNDPQIADTQ